MEQTTRQTFVSTRMIIRKWILGNIPYWKNALNQSNLISFLSRITPCWLLLLRVLTDALRSFCTKTSVKIELVMLAMTVNLSNSPAIEIPALFTVPLFIVSHWCEFLSKVTENGVLKSDLCFNRISCQLPGGGWKLNNFKNV